MTLEEATAKALAAKTPDWDPEDHERFWMNHSTTGEKGWLVRRHGVLHVKLNRPDDTSRPYRANDWMPDRAHRPFTRQQIVKAAFEFDRELCLMLGDRRLASRQWNSLTERQRRQWMEKGPETPPIRRKMFRLITEEMESVIRVT